MKLRRYFVLAFLALTGCAEIGAADQHDTEVANGHFDTSPSRFRWVALDEAEFMQIGVAPPFRVGKPVAPGHAAYFLVERMQAWADRVHAVIGEQYASAHPGEELPIPRPRVRIVPAKDANAWAAGVPVCLNVPLAIDIGDPGRPASSKDKVVLLADDVKDNLLGRIFGGGPERCATAPWSDDIEGFVEFFNAQGGKCKVKLVDGTLHVGGEGCRYNGTRTHANTTVVYATAPFISFTSEMIAIATSEAPIVGTLTHELGHYYQSHPSSGFIGSRYRFWYEQQEQPSPARPIPAADSADVTSRLEELFPMPIPAVPEQRFSPRLTGFLLDAVGGTLIPAACGSSCACSPALEILAGEWKNELSCLGCSLVSEEAEQKYRAFEAALLECADDIVVAKNAGAGAIPLADFRERVKWEDLLELEPTTYPASASLAELLAILNDAAGALDAEKAALLAEIRDRHLGLYTMEQEADDFSLEYFAAIGNKPSDRVKAALSLTRYQWEKDPRAFMEKNAVEYGELEHLYQDKWRDDGHYVFIPLGSLHDEHHGMSYRVFNLSRELTAHAYKKVGSPLGAMTKTWAKVRSVAVALRDEVPPPRPFSNMPAQGDSTSPIIVDPHAW